MDNKISCILYLGNVLLPDKESNNPSHMIDTLMCVRILRLVDDMVCA